MLSTLTSNFRYVEANHDSRCCAYSSTITSPSISRRPQRLCVVPALGQPVWDESEQYPNATQTEFLDAFDALHKHFIPVNDKRIKGVQSNVIDPRLGLKSYAIPCTIRLLLSFTPNAYL